MKDDLTLTIGIHQLSGWTGVRVTRGIERCPSDFEIGMTELYPGQIEELLVQAGDACTVKLGDDLVLTGYVDRVDYNISPDQHTVAVIGRGKCADLVDCSAEWPGFQISGSDALGIAQKLAQPYLINVSAAPDSKGVRVERFNLMLGETAWEIIERVCRFGAVLAYDQPDGNLLLSQAAKVVAASGFTEGQNVQKGSMSYSMDQRFSIYECVTQSMDRAMEKGEGGNLLGTASDEGVPRHRNKVLISEAPAGGRDFAQKRVTWEANRRIGRSAKLNVVTDGWRDAAGMLWAPNTLVPLSLPTLKCGNEDKKEIWLVTEVAYHRDASSGTTCALTMMRPEAFLPMPIIQPDAKGKKRDRVTPDSWGNEARR